MALTVRKLAPNIGAEICDIDLQQDHDAEVIAEINRIWLDSVILLFRGQELTPERQVEVTGWFGEVGNLARPKKYRTSGHNDLPPGMMLISNVRENGKPIGNLPDGEMMFHHDMIHAREPHKATLLYAVEIPSYGGNTLFANGYTAYETLPDEIREPLEGRLAFHHYNYGTLRKGDNEGTPAFSEAEHPVFRTHDDTGRKAVYVNRLMTEGVVGMDQEEASPLLAALFDHAERSEFVYEHEWAVGDLLLWDNRCSMHARRDFPGTERRLMRRTTVIGNGPPA